MIRAMPRYDPSGRAMLLSSWLLLVFAGLLARLAHLQLFQHDAFTQQAMAQRTHTMPLTAPRGDILDRHGRILATTRPAYRLHLLYPSYVEKRDRATVPSRVLMPLAKRLGIDVSELEARAEMAIESNRFSEPFLVKDDLTPEEASWLVELRQTYPGIYIDSHPVRHYPHGEVAAHLLGYVGRITVDELAEASNRGYLPDDQVGKTGLELQYENVLKGTPGRLDLEVDAYFRPTHRGGARWNPAPGQSIRTTIDLDLQRSLQQALARTLAHVRQTPDWEGVHFPQADAGAAVVLDVKTGAVLAMASYPVFDPNTYALVRTRERDMQIQAWHNDIRGRPMYNRAIQDAYAPGSTWKMLSAVSALEHGVVSTHEQVVCHGVYDKIEPKLDWKKDGHGPLDMVNALAHSCNIYFYEMGYRLGIERMAETAAMYGFGRVTGLDLPGEAPGWIPDKKRREAHPDQSPWNGGRMLSAAIGQGPEVTPVQLARFGAVLANGGAMVRPHVVEAIIGLQDEERLVPAPEGRVQIEAEHHKAIVAGMKAVTDWGTSRLAFTGLPFKVAGKTGTAEVTGSEKCSEGVPLCQYGLYVAFAPAENPEVAIAVVGERAGHGDSMNPVARAVLAHYFDFEPPPDDPLYRMKILEPR